MRMITNFTTCHEQRYTTYIFMQCEKLRTKTEPFTGAEIKYKLDNERELLYPKS